MQVGIKSCHAASNQVVGDNAKEREDSQIEMTAVSYELVGSLSTALITQMRRKCIFRFISLLENVKLQRMP